MSVIVAFLFYAARVLRKPMDTRLKQRRAGPFVVFALGALLLALWVGRRPQEVTLGYFWGEVIGVAGIYLSSCSLLLATKARWLEPWFGGLDRMYLWHKLTAVAMAFTLPGHILLSSAGSQGTTGASTYQAGLVLGVASLLGLIALVLVSLPQVGKILHLSYYRWLFVHRLIGLFVLIAVLHGLFVDRVTAGSGLLKTVYLAVGVIGMVSYAYEELIMRRRLPTGDYTIERVARPAAGILELHLAPVSNRLHPRAGQFIFVRISGDDAWREHPFTVAGVTAAGHLRLTIRAVGDDTARMHARLQPGLRATVAGPYGRFDYTVGRAHQIWIAGGIGIAPFLSWLTVLDAEDPYTIDVFYSTSTETEAVYLAELRSAEQRLAPLLRVHQVVTGVTGHLTGARVAALTEVTPETHVFLCGPGPMIDNLTRDLHRAGVPRDYIHAEHFSFR